MQINSKERKCLHCLISTYRLILFKDLWFVAWSVCPLKTLSETFSWWVLAPGLPPLLWSEEAVKWIFDPWTGGCSCSGHGSTNGSQNPSYKTSCCGHVNKTYRSWQDWWTVSYRIINIHLQPSPSLTTVRSARPRDRKRQKLMRDREGGRESQASSLSLATTTVIIAIVITSLANDFKW